MGFALAVAPAIAIAFVGWTRLDQAAKDDEAGLADEGSCRRRCTSPRPARGFEVGITKAGLLTYTTEPAAFMKLREEISQSLGHGVAAVPRAGRAHEDGRGQGEVRRRRGPPWSPSKSSRRSTAKRSTRRTRPRC
ncbi:hypothetical protein O0235_06290 [Tepidiforma flava]|uniref:Uncharacterized protein n=1 Tax=Tepidiforma flava TaxID=3004094 RepID=A0ABY7MA67_9CHLR|nr:hypothetical protein [Tepidiforma flava]WBL37172.1 hypothetical protein O0235_06290 [Tepidiforma flava]